MKDYPPENSSLWYTKIWFVNNSRDRIVEVQFQPAPAAYGIRYYNIQLRQIKYSRYEGMTSRLTTHAKMEFAMSSSVRVFFFHSLCVIYIDWFTSHRAFFPTEYVSIISDVYH